MLKHYMSILIGDEGIQPNLCLGAVLEVSRSKHSFTSRGDSLRYTADMGCFSTLTKREMLMTGHT